MGDNKNITSDSLGLPIEILEKVPGGYHFCEYNPETGNPFVYISPRFLEIVGWTREEIKEKFDNKFSPMVHPDDFIIGHKFHTTDGDENDLGKEDKVYRILGKNGYLWVTGSANETIIKGKKYIQGTISEITSFMKKEEKYKLALEESNKKIEAYSKQLIKQLEIMDSVTKLFTCIYYIDLQDYSFIELGNVAEHVRDVICKHGDAKVAFDNMCQYLIAPDDVETMRDFTNLDTMSDRLKNHAWLSQQFYGLAVGWSEGIFIAVDKDDSGHCRHILWCIRDIHEQKEKEIAYEKELYETHNILSISDIGIWQILMIDGKKPRLKVDAKMRELLSLQDEVVDEEEIYEAWYSRIKPGYEESVNNSVAAMMTGVRDENTYIWIDPILGEQYVRCGGVGERIHNGWLLKGYHFNVDSEVRNEQRREEEQKRLLELRMETISEAIHGGFKLGKNDQQFSFIMVSEQLAELIGYDSPEEMMEASGGCMLNIVNREDAARELPIAKRAVEAGEMYTMRYRLRCKDGSWKNVEDRGRLITNEKGEAQYWSFISDQDLLRELETANEAKTNFLFNMSHDIRTPMNAILGYSQLMKKDLTDPKLLDYQEKIEQSGNTLLSIINNVLDMARIESGKAELDENYAIVEPVATEILNLFDEEAKKKNIDFSFDIDIEHSYVFCDATKVKEVFINLISNAIKYTPAGGKVVVAIKEIPSDREGYVKLKTEISDTGIGMSKDYLPQLFDSFSRERNTTIGKVPGTGLGMTIVKKLIDLMNGTIEVESELGKGTKFTVVLYHKIADKTYFEYKQNLKKNGKSKEVLKGKRILLAEDNELNAEIALVILRDMGLVVDRVEDGVQCVTKIEQMPAGSYDLILMDIQMPNLDGYKATESIRKLKDLNKSGIPIIAMTANAFEENKRHALESGMNGHISKPIDVNSIEEVLVSFLQ